jgi:hypothetical protein
MAWSFHFGAKQAIAALALLGFVASSVSAMTFPATHERQVVVNRTLKGDQMTRATVGQEPRINPAATEGAAPLKRPPLGCDGAFSPVADPARANIFRRCMT